MRLTVVLKNGRSISGVYDWLGALARIDFALKLDDFESFALTEVA